MSAVPAPGVRGGAGGPAAHEHAWSLLRFELVDGHPYAAQSCAGCGATRRYRAWEREWAPGDPVKGRARHPAPAARTPVRAPEPAGR